MLYGILVMALGMHAFLKAEKLGQADGRCVAGILILTLLAILSPFILFGSMLAGAHCSSRDCGLLILPFIVGGILVWAPLLVWLLAGFIMIARTMSQKPSQ